MTSFKRWTPSTFSMTTLRVVPEISGSAAPADGAKATNATANIQRITFILRARTMRALGSKDAIMPKVI
ncbi:MAG: hypothetical protein ACREUC_19655, partial [Steroidobacteraceae bacterium]